MIELISEGCIPNTHNKRYIIDSPEERSNLEVDFGNEAYCISNKTTYICNGSGVYVEKGSSGGGGGGGELFVVELTPYLEEDDFIVAEADEPLSVILDASRSGKQVWVKANLGGRIGYGLCNMIVDVDGDTIVGANFVDEYGTSLTAFAAPSEEMPNRWLIAQRYIRRGHGVDITVDENYNLVSEQTLDQIYGWLVEGDNVTLHFQHPDYEGYWYDLPITARGTNGENFFLAAQLVDPYSSALSLLWASGSGGANEWTMSAYPISNS